jgi:hypothetical protein
MVVANGKLDILLNAHPEVGRRIGQRRIKSIHQTLKKLKCEIDQGQRPKPGK